MNGKDNGWVQPLATLLLPLVRFKDNRAVHNAVALALLQLIARALPGRECWRETPQNSDFCGVIDSNRSEEWA